MQAPENIVISLQDPHGEILQAKLELNINTTVKDLNEMMNQLVQTDQPQLYSFFYDNKQIKLNLLNFIQKLENFNTELELPVVYHTQSLFYVNPITRQASSLPGHAESILNVQFSPNGQQLASASGDKTVRFWDMLTETPEKTMTGHKSWVLVLSYSPNGKYLISGDSDGDCILWDKEGEKLQNLRGHKKFITSFSWEPFHINSKSSLVCSASKDCTVRLWNIMNRQNPLLVVLTGHNKNITKVLWGGEGLIYTASEDTYVKVWEKTGKFMKNLKHGHWVNTLSLNTEFALKTGGFTERQSEFESEDEMLKSAIEKYNKLKQGKPERLVSGSDDQTLKLWTPYSNHQTLITTMTGHQQAVNHVQYSPNGNFIVSASFDKKIKVWNGVNGKFIASLVGHVASVYWISWSPDSRFIASASKDTTIKVWDMKEYKLRHNLPGHSDEVYTIDWSITGDKVCSGSKDKLLKIWKN